MNPKIKILYVDDEKLNLMLFESFFTDEYEIFTALNGPQALDLLIKNPDIKFVFSDLQMPGMNGVEFIRTAKEKYSEKMYYLVSAYCKNTPAIQEAIEINLTARYLRKPLSRNELHEIINEAVNNYSI